MTDFGIRYDHDTGAAKIGGLLVYRPEAVDFIRQLLNAFASAPSAAILGAAAGTPENPIGGQPGGSPREGADLVFLDNYSRKADAS